MHQISTESIELKLTLKADQLKKIYQDGGANVSCKIE